MSVSGAWIAMKIGSTSPVLLPGCQSWSGEAEAEELDGTTAEDDGYDHPDDGVKRLTVNATIVVDIVGSDFDGITAGTMIENLKLYKNIADTTPIYALPYAKVFRANYRGAVKDRVTYDLVIKSVGEFTFNG